MLRLAGLIAFHFSCYGVGIPRCDSYGRVRGGEARVLAPKDFVARLPQRLLEQGALAVVGHVDRAWGYSFLSTDGAPSGLHPAQDFGMLGLLPDREVVEEIRRALWREAVDAA